MRLVIAGDCSPKRVDLSAHLQIPPVLQAADRRHTLLGISRAFATPRWIRFPASLLNPRNRRGVSCPGVS